jgi:uncharacterized membrane protein
MMSSHKNGSRNLKIIISIIALLGLAIMVYLTYIHYANASSFCDISETVSCDVVTTSIYSEVFGIPVSVTGIGFFAVVILLMWFSKSKQVYHTTFFLTLFVLMPSLYLSLLEATVIGAWCPLCETSKVLMVGILIAAFIGAKHVQKITAQMMIPVVIAGVVAAGVMYFAQTGTVVEEDHSELVACMNDAGVTYYKSFKCSNCKRQEKLLGDAYSALRSVECHPDGPGGSADLANFCLSKNVTHTPTFILEQDGEEIDRVVGLQSIDALAEFAGCEPEITN